jgi:hypothetical protein
MRSKQYEDHTSRRLRCLRSWTGNTALHGVLAIVWDDAACHRVRGELPCRIGVGDTEEEPQLSSIFYVFYLFALSVDQPFTTQVYPEHVPLYSRPWPNEVILWTHLSSRALNLKDLANQKHGFFSDQTMVCNVFVRRNDDQKHYWKDQTIVRLFLDLYSCIWPADQSGFMRAERFMGGPEMAQIMIKILRDAPVPPVL